MKKGQNLQKKQTKKNVGQLCKAKTEAKLKPVNGIKTTGSAPKPYALR